MISERFFELIVEEKHENKKWFLKYGILPRNKYLYKPYEVVIRVFSCDNCTRHFCKSMKKRSLEKIRLIGVTARQNKR